MLTNEQKSKIRDICVSANMIINELLRHFNLAGDHYFETEVFLNALAEIEFPKDLENVMEDITHTISFYAGEGDDGEEVMRRRLVLYTRAADRDILPCGFWSANSINSLYGHRVLRMVALYGDFLVYPDCAWGYDNCRWPDLSPQDITIFSKIFSSRIIPEVIHYLKAVSEVLAESREEF